MKKEFRDIYDQLKAPQEWKTHTLQKMHEARQKNDTRSFAAVEGLKWRYAALFPVAAILCIILFSPFEKNSIYKTPLTDDEYYSIVELQDGIVQFVEKGTLIVPLPNAGNAGSEETKQNEPEREVYSFKGDARITVEETAGGNMEKIPEKFLSNIAGQELFVSVGEQDGVRIYESKYVKDNSLYFVQGIGVSQKQFIDFLVDFISR